ncbi:hypothetical protein ACF0H5_024092 [Mactra antiquata]
MMASINKFLVVATLVFTFASTVYSGQICLSGIDLVSPQDANLVVECGPHETCYLEKYVTPNGFVLSKVGCKDTQYCGASSIASPNIGVCSECCSDDLCAPTLCKNGGWPTGTGPICYHCQNPLTDPANCPSIKTCGRDGSCGVFKESTGKYTVQCMEKAICASHYSTSTCALCCTTNLCNTNCTQHVITTPPTTAQPTTLPATPAPTTQTMAATTPACVDDPTCPPLLQTFQNAGKDICTQPSFKYFCNKTCSLCPGMTTTPPTTTKMNVCSLSPCIHGTCSVLPSGTFSCACDPGYVDLLCDKTDPCAAHPCQHGTCTTFNNGTFVCTCDAGYQGNLCDTASGPCTSNPCMHGKCYDNGASYTCACYTGYIGQQCDTVDPCTASPCAHGVCTTLTNGSFDCICNTGYTGVLCDKDSGPCTHSPCVHGSCVEVANSFACVCDPDYVGDLCDKKDPCNPSPCQHGTCQVQSNGHIQCHCQPGYDGALCDNQVITCASSHTLCNHGTCHNNGNSYTCSCNTGWTGQNCLKPIKDCKDVQSFGLSGTSTQEVSVVTIGGHQTNILCDMQTDGGGWTVIMNRQDGSVNFPDETYSKYEEGFGDIRSNFWAGLDKMHNLTSDGRAYQLRVELTVANGTTYVANYDDFSIGPPSEYVLHIGQYSGTAGDSLSGHNGFGFTTKEVDHDSNDGTNCGWYLNGAWWFHTCYDSCLTCPYKTPGTNNEHNCRVFSWNELGYCIALKSARMMVRPM